MARAGSFVVTCVFVLTLPALGAVGVCLVIVPAWRSRREAERDGVLEIGMPLYADHDEDAQAPRLAATPLEAVLRSTGSPKRRVQAVMALRKLDAHSAVPLLRVALRDTHEDVRLLAYALLERREKDLRGGIEQLQSELEALDENDALVADPRGRATVLRRLAEQHWELVHGHFVTGDVELHTLELARRHGDRALRLVPEGSLALLLARMCLRSADAHPALRYLRAADALGVATAVLAPRYAEVAFLLRRYDAVAPLLAAAGPGVLARPGLAAVAQFWSRSSRV